MSKQRWFLPGLLLVAGFAMWLLLAGPAELLGIDTGHAGMALLVTCLWVSLYAIGNAPRGGLDRAVSPGEWKAWIGTAFMAVAVAYFVLNLEVFQGPPVPDNPEAAVVGRHLVLLLVAWKVLSSVLAARWKGEVEEDERDREIERRAAGWGRGVLLAAVGVLAGTLGLSPPERLQWATHFLVANLLVLSLMLGWLAECATTALYHRRDRR